MLDVEDDDDVIDVVVKYIWSPVKKTNIENQKKIFVDQTDFLPTQRIKRKVLSSSQR